MSSPETSLSAQIAELAYLPMSALWKLWDEHFPRRPTHPNRSYIESRISYKIQEAAYGGLPPELKQRLEAIGAKHSKIKLRSKRREFDFTPGTTLIKEWHNDTHRVLVTDDGRFEYRGQTFKSLTAVARQISGTHWSGPQFFGLHKEEA